MAGEKTKGLINIPVDLELKLDSLVKVTKSFSNYYEKDVLIDGNVLRF
jgi:hypothetical protein